MAKSHCPCSFFCRLPCSKKEQRVKYDYHFSNEIISIDIPDSDYDVLIEMDRLEYNANHKETRSHISLEACD